jgi:uncharacterized protein YdaU (DUF1376 family)
MAKDPAFLFYPGDWLGGTIGMTLEEKGAYMELLVMQFHRGHMTSDMIGQLVGHLWDKLKVKFTQDEQGLWYNRRLDEEKTKRKAFVDSRINNKAGKNQYSKTKNSNGHLSGHMTSHMENENENENKDQNKSEAVIKKVRKQPIQVDTFKLWSDLLKAEKTSSPLAGFLHWLDALEPGALHHLYPINDTQLHDLSTRYGREAVERNARALVNYKKRSEYKNLYSVLSNWCEPKKTEPTVKRKAL